MESVLQIVKLRAEHEKQIADQASTHFWSDRAYFPEIRS